MRRTLAVAAMLFAMAFGTAHAATGDLRQFAFGAFHRCALMAGGAVQCLGESNHFGQIGSGQSGENAIYRPVRVIARGATKLAAGDFFNCAIVGGALDCWGDIPVPGNRGLLPTRVIAGGVTDVAAGERHVCAIVSGAVQCWGADSTGQSGHGDYVNGQDTPWTVIESGASGIAAGGEQSCAIVAGALWCWGRTGLERNPMDTAFGGGRPPIRVIANGVTGVAAGTLHTCAVVEGALWCWGDNTHGQVGIGVSVDHARHSPNMPPANATAAFVDGEQHCFSALAIEVKCAVDHPVKVMASGVNAVTARYDRTCAIVGGALQCWGSNDRGQLGIASSGADVLKPTQVIASGVTSVAVGTSACAMADGELRCSDKGAFDSTDSPFEMSHLEARRGVWRGAIGEQAVMVCLDRSPAESSYYYLRHNFGIALSDTSEHGAVWIEGIADKRGPTWKLRLPADDRLDGEWSDAEGKRILPIRLTRVPSAEGQDPGCAYDGAPKAAFNEPRVASQKLTVAETKGHYRLVSALAGNISWVELPDGMQSSAAFNQAMRGWFRYQVAEYYWCALQPHGGDFHTQREIAFHADPWLVVQESYQVYCGGAHPSGGIAGYQTWNLAIGKQVEPWSWIRGAKAEYGYAAPARLNAIILAKATSNKGEDDCKDAINENSAYLLRPAQRGLVFSTSFSSVIQACDEDIEVPYATLMPLLTREGRSAVESLMKARPAAAVSK